MTNRCSVQEEQMRHDAEQELEGDRYNAFEVALEQQFENNEAFDKAVEALKDLLAEIEEACADMGYAGDEDSGTYAIVHNALDELGGL